MSAASREDAPSHAIADHTAERGPGMPCDRSRRFNACAESEHVIDEGAVNVLIGLIEVLGHLSEVVEV